MWAAPLCQDSSGCYTGGHGKHRDVASTSPDDGGCVPIRWARWAMQTCNGAEGGEGGRGGSGRSTVTSGSGESRAAIRLIDIPGAKAPVDIQHGGLGSAQGLVAHR